RFDLRTGEPVSWAPAADEIQVYAWAREWVAEEWQDWAPRTRQSVIESLARFVTLVCDRNAPAPPKSIRQYLHATLPPDVDIDESHECERWLKRWCLSLGELDKVLLADVDRRLGIGDKGQPLAPATAARHRKNAHTCIRRAVELE